MINRLMLLMVFLTGVITVGSAQYSEVEILGRKRYPFIVFLDVEQQNAHPESRVSAVVKGKESVQVRLLFSDSLVATLSDSINLEDGYRMVYRLVEAPTHPGDPRKSLADKLSTLFRAPGEEEAREPMAFRLSFLEMVHLPETAAVGQQDTAVALPDTAPAISSPQSFYFTRADHHRRDDSLQMNAGWQQQTDSLPKQGNGTITGTPGTSPILLSEAQHQQHLKRLAELRFEEDRLKYLNTNLKDVSLSSLQLTELLGKLDFERSKMQVCKSFYQQLTDKEQAALLFGAFEFSSSVEELKKWIHEQPR